MSCKRLNDRIERALSEDLTPEEILALNRELNSMDLRDAKNENGKFYLNKPLKSVKK